jgi:hypothetical protein
MCQRPTQEKTRTLVNQRMRHTVKIVSLHKEFSALDGVGWQRGACACIIESQKCPRFRNIGGLKKFHTAKG